MTLFASLGPNLPGLLGGIIIGAPFPLAPTGKAVSVHALLQLPTAVKEVVMARLGRRRARLAQSVEHETLNLGVVGSSPTSGGSDCDVTRRFLTSLQ